MKISATEPGSRTTDYTPEIKIRTTEDIFDFTTDGVVDRVTTAADHGSETTDFTPEIPIRTTEDVFDFTTKHIAPTTDSTPEIKIRTTEDIFDHTTEPDHLRTTNAVDFETTEDVEPEVCVALIHHTKLLNFWFRIIVVNDI